MIVTRRNPPDAVRQNVLRSLARWREAGLTDAQIKRDNELRRLGYEIVHFTWDELFGDPERVVKDILDAMRKQRLRYRR